MRAGRPVDIQQIGTWDVVIAGALTLLAQVELWRDSSLPVLAAFVSLVITGALVLRSAAPFASSLLVIGAFGVQTLVLDPAPQLLGNGLALLVTLYSSAVFLGARRSAPFLPLVAAASLVFWAQQGDMRPAGGDMVMAGTAWAIGLLVRKRGRSMAERLAAADDELRAADLRAEEALAEERRRVARELHDVVSHAITVVVLQARGASTLLDDEPERARDALFAIEQAGQEALAEMRRLVSFLREPPSDTTPQPGLGDVPALVATAQREVSVDLHVTGDPVAVAVGPGLTAYRLVQECLTNALRHAPGAPISVQLDYSPRQLTITVSNPVRGRTDGGGGFGLAGQRERIALYGGNLTFGAVNGVWRVVGILPLEVVPGEPVHTESA